MSNPIGVLVKCRLDEEGQLLARTAAYTLVQYAYEYMPAEEVKSHILGPAGGDQVSPFKLTSLAHTPRALADAELPFCPRVYNLGPYSLRSCCCSSSRLRQGCLCGPRPLRCC